MSLLLFFALLSSWAAPDVLEVWFLSPPSTGQWEHLLQPRLTHKHWLAQACEPVGDFCFDPQVGLYSRRGREPEEETTKFVVDEGLPQLPTATSVDRSVVNCDAKYAFDLFCGKAVPEPKDSAAAGLEIWVDTSSSMRGIDGSEACQRGAFLRQLVQACGSVRPTIKGFDTSLREMDPEGACAHQGLNNAERLAEWIEESRAKRLIVITDVYEYQSGLANFLESKKARLRGDSGTFPASKMLDLVSELAKACATP